MKKLFLLLNVILILTSCSSTPQDCDPRVELSLLGKMSCKMSGSYDERINIKEKELKAAKDLNKDLNDEDKILRNQNKIVKMSLAQKSSQLDKLNKRLTYLKKVNAKSKNPDSEQEAEIRELEADIEKLKQAISL